MNSRKVGTHPKKSVYMSTMVHPSFFVPRKIRSDPCRGLKVVDVVGWAPTADTLALAENKCTKERFTGFTIVQPTVTTANANNEAC